MAISQSRENAFLILFEASFRDDELEALYALAEEIGEITVDSRVRSLVQGVTEHQEELDTIISSYSRKRAVERIARIDLVLLRMAIYEIRYCPRVPVNVAVSEAVRLSEVYTSSEDTAFINGILGAYSRTAPEREAMPEEA